MRLSTITNWAYAVTLVLTVISAGAFILSSRAATQERAALEQRLALDELGEDLALMAEERTDEIRLYVMRGGEAHLAGFYLDENKERQLEASLARLTEWQADSEEKTSFETIRTLADALDRLENDAIAALRAGKRQDAQNIIFSDAHYQAHSKLISTVDELRNEVARRSQAEVDAAKAASDLYGLVARIMLSLTAALFVAVLYFILKRRVAVPLNRMSGIVNRLAKQDFAVEVPLDPRRDEIGELNQAIQIFRDNGLERERLDAERQRERRIKDLILQMMHRVQACQNQEELADVAAKFMPQIFPTIPGQLFVVNETKGILALASSWLDPRSSRMAFAIDECWGLRRGRPHLSEASGGDVVCPHIEALPDTGAICIPLTALGLNVGLLYLELPASAEVDLPSARLYLELIAENLGLAVANLQLRQRLTTLARRDALTGLLNRRSLDEALNRFREQPEERLSCLMVDIDHFKQFNDRYGHEAGDAVMQSVSRILNEVVRDGGDVYRFGGEEFTLLLPDTEQSAAMLLAERLREAVERSPFSHRDRMLDPVTVSIGVAAAPDEGPVSSLVDRADTALLRAKQSGRNRVLAA